MNPTCQAINPRNPHHQSSGCSKDSLISFDKVVLLCKTNELFVKAEASMLGSHIPDEFYKCWVTESISPSCFGSINF